ncbi:hypothetical protein [Streptomyces sp. NPDC050145]|uniref:hypothetical protein n=1 Tax=Streptomyces sp. NPDC050145 TaxID=3365602 RepID=UPI00378C9BF0
MSTEEIPAEPSARPGRPRRRAALLVGLVVVLAAQTGVLVAQQLQISDLQNQRQAPGPAGPSGPVGPAGAIGPRGAPGPAGKDGADGQDAAPAVVVPPDSDAHVPAALSRTEAHAHCQTVADEAYPGGSDSGDEALDTLTDEYSATMQQKTFAECMSEQGYPQ